MGICLSWALSFCLTAQYTRRGCHGIWYPVRSAILSFGHLYTWSFASCGYVPPVELLLCVSSEQKTEAGVCTWESRVETPSLGSRFCFLNLGIHLVNLDLIRLDQFLVNFWSSGERSERHVAAPKTGLSHAPTSRLDAPVFDLACYYSNRDWKQPRNDPVQSEKW